MAIRHIRQQMKSFDCVNCKQSVTSNWYMRHVQKCVTGHPGGKQLMDQARQVYVSAMSEGDEIKDKQADSEFMVDDFVKTLSISTKTLSRYKQLLEEKGFQFPKLKNVGYKRRIEYTPDVINLFTDLVEMKSLYSLDEAAEKVVAKYKQKPVPNQPNQVVAQQLIIPLPEQTDNETILTKKNNNIDDLPYATTNETKSLLADLSPKFKAGDIIEGTITSIEVYGVFVNQGLYIRGMIHKTNVMKNTNNPDLYAYFKVGDIVKSEVLAVKPDGKLTLSTKNMNLKPLSETALGPFAKLAELLPNDNQESEVKTVETHTLPPVVRMDKNLDDIVDFIKSKVGIVSPAAKELIADLYRKHGMLAFSMSLGVVSDSFEVDLGLALIREVEKKLDDSL